MSEKAGNNGVVPPKAHRWKPGQSGNPAGRKTYGAYAREWMNAMVKWPVGRLRRVINDPDAPAVKVAAAIRVLRARTSVDLEAFEPFIRGEKTLGQLKREGVDTSVIKKIKRIPTKHGDKIELEFHDWSGEEFDRAADRTEGKPHQTQTVEHKSAETPEQVLDRVRQLAGLANPPANAAKQEGSGE